MQRRSLLVSSGVALSTLFAGCAGESEEVDGGSRNDDDGDDEDGEDGPSGEANLEIVDHELVIEPGQFSTDVYVEAIIENSGDAPSGNISIQADWYDDDGNYLDNDTSRLESLGVGETWECRVYHLGTGSEDVADYEVEGEFDTDSVDPDADGLSLLESNLNTTDRDVEVNGQIENGRDDDVSYVQVTAKIYDDEGVVMGDAWTNVTDFRAGETWSFDVTWHGRDRINRAADHEILIADSAW